MFKIAKIRASQMVSQDEIVAYRSNMKAGFLSIFDKYLFLHAQREAKRPGTNTDEQRIAAQTLKRPIIAGSD